MYHSTPKSWIKYSVKHGRWSETQGSSEMTVTHSHYHGMTPYEVTAVGTVVPVSG